MWSVGSLILYQILQLTGVESSFAYGIGFTLSYLLTFGLVVWAADVFTRCVVLPSVKLQQKLEKLVLRF